MTIHDLGHEVALYVNGLAIAHNGKEVRACFSPFTLVRNCKFQDSATCSQLMSLKIFKIFFFVKNLCYFFGVSADDEGLAEKERQQWVADVARAVPLSTPGTPVSFRDFCPQL